MVEALLDIFTISMDSASVDESMKSAFITPIWKGGDKTAPSSYRPVALTTHLSKLMERLVRAPIVAFLEENGLLDPSQHGARAGRSTLTQLLTQHDHILKLLENGNNVDMIYLDFAKAFDKVDLGLLLRKIQGLGIRGTLGRWLSDFLTKRRQAVWVGAGLSDWARVISGVPQGSVLGPLMFLIFIGDMGADLPASSNTLLLKYVDDTKAIHPVMAEEDVEEFQATLDTLYAWQVENNMEWNGKKFVCVRMGPLLVKENTMLFTPGVGDPIQEEEAARDLGILIDHKADFRPQRQAVAAKTAAKAAWVLRTFQGRGLPLMRTLWRTLVQPHQDYGSQLWSPVGLHGDLHLQESPLRAFTKRVSGLQGLPYWERLERMKLLSTERRQERYKIIYTWKALKGLVPFCGISLAPGSGTRSGQIARVPSLSGTRMAVRTLRDRFLTVEGPRLYNSLPQDLRDLDLSLDAFKGGLDRWLSSSVPDCPPTQGRRHPATDLWGSPCNSIRSWVRTLGPFPGDKWSIQDSPPPDRTRT